MSETTEELERLVEEAAHGEVVVEAAHYESDKYRAVRQLRDMAPTLAAEVLAGRKALAYVLGEGGENRLDEAEEAKPLYAEWIAASPQEPSMSAENGYLAGFQRGRKAYRNRVHYYQEKLSQRRKWETQARKTLDFIATEMEGYLEGRAHNIGCIAWKARDALAALEVPDGE